MRRERPTVRDGSGGPRARPRHRGATQDDALRVVRAVRDVDVYIEQPCLSYEECLTIRRHCDHPFVLDEVIDSIDVLLRGQPPHRAGRHRLRRSERAYFNIRRNANTDQSAFDPAFLLFFAQACVTRDLLSSIKRRFVITAVILQSRGRMERKFVCGREVFPADFGGIDFSPLVVILIIIFLRSKLLPGILLEVGPTIT